MRKYNKRMFAILRINCCHHDGIRLIDWLTEHGLTSPPTQYRLYGRRFLQVKRPNQQYQNTEGTQSTRITQKYNKHSTHINTKHSKSPGHTNTMGDGAHRGQGRQTWTAVVLPLRYPPRQRLKKTMKNCSSDVIVVSSRMDWTEQCFTSPPTQYRLYGRRLLQVKRPNQQYQSTEGTYITQRNQTYNNQTINTASPLVYNNMGWLRDGSHRGQGR